MEHATIDEQNLIELYLQGRLELEVESRFEEHFLDCPRCQEELEMARGFDIGIRTVAAQQAAAAAVVLRSGILARLATWSRHRAGVAALAAVAFIAGALLFGGPGTPGPGTPGPGTPGSSTPIAGTPVFLLSIQRGESGAVPGIDLPTAREALILAVDVGDDARFASYRVRVEGSSGAELWSQGNLLPNALEALMITFPPSFFEAGTFFLTVDGELPGGETAEVGRYSFRVSGERLPARS
jgi:hypothetical protein